MLVDFMKRYTVNRDQLRSRKTMCKQGRGSRQRLIQWMVFLEPLPSPSRWNPWHPQCHRYHPPPSLGQTRTGRASRLSLKPPCTPTPTLRLTLNTMAKTLLDYQLHHPPQQQPRQLFMEVTSFHRVSTPLKLNQKLWNLFDLRFDLSGLCCCNCIHSLF